MKIGLSSNALKHSGGLERYAMDLVQGLSTLGNKPVFFTRHLDFSLPESRMVEPYPVHVSFLPGKLRDYWFSWRLRNLRRVAQVDVLIGCNRVDSSDIAICGGTHRGFLRAIGRTPRISDRWQIALEQAQYNQAKIIVAHSQSMYTELRELYNVDTTKIRTLYPPVDEKCFTPVDQTTRLKLRRQFGFSDNEIVLLFPSSSHERKGLSFIETAVADTELPIVIAIAGRRPKHIGKRMRYIGYAKNIEDYYRAADFTILASKYEPFGLVGIESVMCGTPVIFPSNIGCCEVIAAHAKHVFNPGNPASLRTVLEQAVHLRLNSSQPGQTSIACEDILYDTNIINHVSKLLELAKTINVKKY